MNRQIIFLATLTLIGFPAMGWGILWVFDGPSFFGLFELKLSFWIQLGVGITVGLIAGGIAWVLVSSNMLAPVRKKYGYLIRQFDLTNFQIVYVSLCAGIGEEILFRGIVQPFLGIWPTAVIFVAIHGYLNPMNWRLFFYGTFMTVVIGAIGYMARDLGLFSAMAAHALIDMVLLWKLSQPSRIETMTALTSFKEETDPNL